VVLVPIADDGRLILIRQYRASVGRELWEIPAGSVDEGETPDQAAARECEEEIGLAPGRIERVRGLFPTPGFCDEELIFYRVSQLRPPAADSPHKPDDDEDIRSQLVTIEEARSMVERGEIIDLKTAYGLTLV
jgi:ADP-ribose pyrophosphatase